MWRSILWTLPVWVMSLRESVWIPSFPFLINKNKPPTNIAPLNPAKRGFYFLLIAISVS